MSVCIWWQNDNVECWWLPASSAIIHWCLSDNCILCIFMITRQNVSRTAIAHPSINQPLLFFQLMYTHYFRPFHTKWLIPRVTKKPWKFTPIEPPPPCVHSQFMKETNTQCPNLRVISPSPSSRGNYVPSNSYVLWVLNQILQRTSREICPVWERLQSVDKQTLKIMSLFL